MKKLLRYLYGLQLPVWSIPIALLAVCIMAYGLLIPKLGFYQDDWHFVYYAYTRGAAGLAELLNYDGHPLAAPLYIASFNLLGFNPVNWQIFSLIWRWLAVVAFWLVIYRIWPAQRRVSFTAAAIYIVYPLFTLQSMTIVYFEVWISHFLLAASFLLTIEAIKQPKRFFLFTTLAILLKILHTFSSEYTWGMELARPILIWLAMPSLEKESVRQRLARTLKIYSPYLAIFLVALVWRGFLYRSPVLARSDPHLLDTILLDPVNGIKGLVLNAIPDMVLILVSTWFSTVSPAMFSLDNSVNLQILGLLLVCFFALGAFLSKLEQHREAGLQSDKNWKLEALIFGAAVLIFGMLPIYAAGYFIFQKLEPWNGRFVMGSMPGVALLTALFIEFLLDTPRKRLVLAALLISLGIGWQVRAGNEFRWAWSSETSFYRQMLLRAPGIAPHTAIISNQEFLGRMGDYPTAFALNTIYATPGSQTSADAKTWLFLIDSNFGGETNALRSGIPLEETKHSTHFIGKSSDSLVIYYEPDLGQCLWLILPESIRIPIIPEDLQKISPLTNAALIQPEAVPSSLLQAILPADNDNWCAHYQRGSLAYQTKSWTNATQEWEQAASKDLGPTNGFEMLPFVESYARLGKWQQALKLTLQADKISKGMPNVLCADWTRFEKETAPDSERDQVLRKVRDSLGCE